MTTSRHTIRTPRTPVSTHLAGAALLTVSLAAGAIAQTPAQFHHGTMGAPHNTGHHTVLLTGIQFRDVRLRNSMWTLSRRVFSNYGITAQNHLKAMSFDRFSLRSAHGLSYYGPFTVTDDPDTRPDESLHRNSVYTETSTSPVLFMGIQTSFDRRFLMAVNGGGDNLKLSGARSVGDPSKTPWEVFALVDPDGGRLRSGQFVGFKTPTGHWLRQRGQYVRADAVRPGYGTWFRIFKAGGSGNIEHGDRFHLVAMNGRYVRSIGNVTTANAVTPLHYGTFTLRRTSIDSMRLGQEIVNQVRSRYRASFRGLDRNRNGVVEWHECSFLMFLANPGTADCGAKRGFGTRTVPGESGVRISTSLIYVGDETNIATLTHELTHNLGTQDIYGSGVNGGMSLMAGTCSSNLHYRVRLDCWHAMRLGWVQPRVINMRGRNSVEIVKAVVASRASFENRPVILFDPARYDLATRSGEFFMIEARKRVAGRYDDGLASEGLAVWQVRTDRNGRLGAIPQVGGSGNDSTLNLLSADGRRGGSRLFRPSDGVITPRYIDGRAAPVRLRVSQPIASQPERMFVEISPDGRMRPSISVATGSLRRGGTLLLFGELSPLAAAGTRVYLRNAYSTTLYPVVRPTYVQATIPRYLVPGSYHVVVRQWGKWSNQRLVRIR